ncbi:MAG TPA: alanine racemase [Candidatus Binatia bacterium]|nr:alanine racemase [Candidatus Binatia bacterium]
MRDVHGRPTVAEVSLSALRANCGRARELVGPSVAVMAVVKADAYGHGAAAAARAFLDAGAAALGVSTVEEAVELRRAGIGGPMVVLGGAFAGEEDAVVAHDLAAAVSTPAAARALSAAAARAGRTVALHLKVDTGMTRLGCDAGDLAALGTAVAALPHVAVAGVFSHFASADEVETATARAQLARFAAAVEALAAAGVRPPHVHLANSAAVLALPAAHFTMVRPGLMLYGYAPAPHLAARAALRPAMRFRTAVALVRRVEAGRAVGYGGTWVAQRPSTIAVLPVGYADGYHRLASNRAQVALRGRRVPVAGRVCMDHTMLDVTDVPGVAVGDRATLFGDGIGADELGGWCETIAYEVLTAVGKRVPRVHVEDFTDG